MVKFRSHVPLFLFLIKFKSQREGTFDRFYHQKWWPMAHKLFGNLKTDYYHDNQTFQVSFQLLFCSFLALC